MHNEFWEGADLVMEVVSEDRRRDFELKRTDYARAGIPEYWIIDPKFERVTVLSLKDGAYVVRGEFHRTQQASSALLDGFTIDVTALFDAARI
jgi:Uma2 family endonuclease